MFFSAASSGIEFIGISVRSSILWPALTAAAVGVLIPAAMTIFSAAPSVLLFFFILTVSEVSSGAVPAAVAGERTGGSTFWSGT